jgi:PAS domain S-box-containing protein
MSAYQKPSTDTLRALETAPNMYLILSPDLYILTASDLFLQATETTREKICGKHIFEAFPDNSDLPDADGIENINSSLQQVLKSKKPHHMPVQRYDVPDGKNPGKFIQRYWNPSHTPVLDADDEIQYIIQLATNVTEGVLKEMELEQTQQNVIQLNDELETRILLTEKLKAKNEEQRMLNDKLLLSEKESDMQRRRLDRFFKDAPVGICILEGSKHIYVLVNPAYQRLNPDRELLGTPVAQAATELSGMDRESILDAVYTTGRTHQTPSLLVPLANINGGPIQNRYFNFIYQPRFDLNNRIIGVLVFVFEITEQVTAKHKIQELNGELTRSLKELAAANRELIAGNEQQSKINRKLEDINDKLVAFRQEAESTENTLSIAIEAANFGTWSFDSKTRKFTTSPRFKELYGFHADNNITPDDCLKQVREDYRPVVSKEIDKSIEKGGIYDVTYPVHDFNNEGLRWIRAVGNIVTEPTGAYSMFTGVVMDVSTQVNALEKIKKSEERFRAISEGPSVYILENNEYNNPAYFNKAWVNLTGRPMQGLLSLGFLDLVHTDDSDRYARLYMNAFDAKTAFTAEFRILTRDGNYRWLLADGSARFNTEGAFDGYIISCVDISELKEDEQRKNNFIAMVSHELKTPLTSLSGYLQIVHSKIKGIGDESINTVLTRSNNQIKKWLP